ncbi:MAG TPA: hypothetical protein VF995_01750 [Actinomycetota bacterium]
MSMFLARFVAVVAGVAMITLITGSERARDTIGRHSRAGWFYVLLGIAALEVALWRGGFHLMVRTLGAGLLFVVLVPAVQVLFGLIDGVWSWSRRRVDRRTLYRESDSVPWR